MMDKLKDLILNVNNQTGLITIGLDLDGTLITNGHMFNKLLDYTISTFTGRDPKKLSYYAKWDIIVEASKDDDELYWEFNKELMRVRHRYVPIPNVVDKLVDLRYNMLAQHNIDVIYKVVTARKNEEFHPDYEEYTVAWCERHLVSTGLLYSKHDVHTGCINKKEMEIIGQDLDILIDDNISIIRNCVTKSLCSCVQVLEPEIQDSDFSLPRNNKVLVLENVIVTRDWDTLF